jgi:hypothetical protein
MSKTIGLIFVLAIISIAHSFPKLSGGNDENAQLARMMALIQSLNTSSALSTFGDKSDESIETADGYVDKFFDTFFDEDDSSEEANAGMSFGPEFDPSQFVARLNNDIDQAYQRKCKKISGSDDTYSKVKAATKELGGCLKRFLKLNEVRSAYSKLQGADDVQSFIRTMCRKRDVPLKCMDDFMAVDAQCSFPSELKIDTSIVNIVHGLLDLFCANNGNDLIALIFGQAQLCFMENLSELKTCKNKQFYAIVKGFLVKLIENETFEFKMNEDDCKAFDESQSCFVSAVENCVDPMPKNYYASIYQIIRKETECAKIAPI